MRPPAAFSAPLIFLMQDVVNEAGFDESACELCKSTGLSLAETLVRARRTAPRASTK